MASAVPPPPTITVEGPSKTTTQSIPASASTIQAPAGAPIPKARPTKPTLVKSCYLCDEQNPGDFSPTTKFLETCLLCSRHFCPIHKSEQWDTVCNINHSQYYKQCLAKARAELQSQGKDVDSAGNRGLAELLINEGIYPSLGEREKAIFSTSPVDNKKVQELEQYRSLDAALTGSSTKPSSQLIEERDVLEADIAV
ncbi:hypothetical protein B0A52_02703 [Exophiala mesophila]|uniref:Uncharacterized protein n=1 Tax=Exophiala mesophila TaxID=212818 RepID=A0A438NDD8_EXOME|nr:hypothetical protein B0A52_02703 [Exophiala mesophila]